MIPICRSSVTPSPPKMHKKFVIGVCVIHWKGCGYLHFVIGLLIVCLLSYQCLLTDTKISGNAHHLQLRDITQNVNKQVVSSENKSRSLTTENVIGLQSIVHKLLDRIMKNDSSEPPRYGLKQSQYNHIRKVNEFCKHFNYSTKLPEDRNRRDGLYQHLLYDDSKKIIFCYVPKAGCSNWKRMFAVLKGTENANSIKRPSSHVLKNINKLGNLSRIEQTKQLKAYFKFAFVRNPLERIVSGYRNKIAVPIKYGNIEHWPDDVLHHIIKTYNKDKYDKWRETNFTSANVYPSFEEFIKYLIDSDLDLLNEHFRPFINLCHPCAVNYNYIGNFYNLPNEAFHILDLLRIPRNYYLNRAAHPAYNTSSLVSNYYNQLSAPLRLKLLKRISQELILYYLLFPTDLQRDMKLLQ